MTQCKWVIPKRNLFWSLPLVGRRTDRVNVPGTLEKVKVRIVKA